MEVKLWLIKQSENTGYDTYDSAVVAAETEEDARMINPDGPWDENRFYGGWCKDPRHVEVKCIGEAIDDKFTGIILASFNAG